MLMSLDQWDWKTNAPEFIPASLSAGGVVTAVAAAASPAEPTQCWEGSSVAMFSGPSVGGMPTAALMDPSSGVAGGGAGQAGMQSGFAGPFSMHPAAFGPSAVGPSPSLAGGFGQLQFGPAIGNGQRRQQPGPSPGHIHGPIGPCQAAAPMGTPEGSSNTMMMPMDSSQGPSSVAQLRAQYEQEILAKDQKLRHLQSQLSREEHDRVQMQADFERDRQGLVRHLNQLVSAVERYGIQVEQPLPDNRGATFNEAWMPSPREGVHMQQPPPRSGGSGLDLKMEQLSDLLREGPLASSSPLGRRDQQHAPGPIGSGLQGSSAGQGSCQDEVLFRPSGRNTSGCGAPGSNPGREERRDGRSIGGNAPGASSSRPRVTFPRDVAPGPYPVTAPVSASSGGSGVGAEYSRNSDDGFRSGLERSIRSLERRAGSPVDEQARQALEGLPPQAVREAVKRVQEALQADDISCSLSSLIQSVCRKIRRRGLELGDSSRSSQVRGTGSGARGHGSADGEVMEHQSARSSWRGSAYSSDQGPGDDSRSSRRRATASAAAPATAGVSGPYSSSSNSNPKTSSSARSSPTEPWSTARLDRLCKQGGLCGLKQVADDAWEMRLQMCDLDPPLCDEGMQVFCRWLHLRIQRMKESKGIRSMRQVRTDVSFARNDLGDAAVGRLLTALQRADLHVATLNLQGNGIGLQGLRHVCDFLHEARCPVFEVHLGHNDIDDDAALELVRTVAEHPRYSQRRRNEPAVQIWLRLNSNPIRDPGKVLWKLESQFGANVCAVRNRQAASRAHAPVLISLEDSSHWVPDAHEAAHQSSSSRHRYREAGAGGQSHSSHKGSGTAVSSSYRAPVEAAAAAGPAERSRFPRSAPSSSSSGHPSANVRSSGGVQPNSLDFVAKAPDSKATSSSSPASTGAAQPMSLPASGISSALRRWTVLSNNHSSEQRSFEGPESNDGSLPRSSVPTSPPVAELDETPDGTASAHNEKSEEEAQSSGSGTERRALTTFAEHDKEGDESEQEEDEEEEEEEVVDEDLHEEEDDEEEEDEDAARTQDSQEVDAKDAVEELNGKMRIQIEKPALEEEDAEEQEQEEGAEEETGEILRLIDEELQD